MAESLENRSAEEQAELLLTLKKGPFGGKMLREDSDEEDEDTPLPDFSALSALGLQRVGEPRPSKELNINLNRRGMPVRVRKKNKMYYDEDHVTTPAQVKTPKKSLKQNTPKKVIVPPPSPPPIPTTPPAPVKVEAPIKPPVKVTHISPNKKVAQNNGYRLRNFLKLPQAHKWVYYEWFYSNLDKPLFGGENDFQIVMKEAFPGLKTRMMSRRQWGLVRKMMGKPRRCSQAFFNEERHALSKRRQILRLLQQRKITNHATLKDLPIPDEIPLQLVVGTKVTARLRKPENGLYTGIIDAVDTSNSTYRITFDRNGIGTHSIDDFEVVSNEAAEMMPVSSLFLQFRPKMAYGLVTPSKPTRPILPRMFGDGPDSPSVSSLNNDPILGHSPYSLPKLDMDRNLGSFPLKNLVEIATLSKILKAKRTKLDNLKDLNGEAEKMRSFEEDMTLDFQRRYAGLILDIEKINSELNRTLLSVQGFCQEISPNPGILGPTLLPSQIRERCYEEAAAIVEVTNNTSGSDHVTNDSILDLITKLTSIMLQIKNMTETEVSAFELTSLTETVSEIKENLTKKSESSFENHVEVHLRHIMSAVSQIGPLQAFKI